jgi:RHS repeat-associated protein
MVVSVGADGSSQLPGPGAAGGHPAQPAPGQRWGDARGIDGPAGVSPNRTLPASLRGQYPLHTGQAQPLNTAEVTQRAPASVRGFDASTSQELPDRRGEYERTFANADGTLTTELSTTKINYQRPDGGWAPVDATLVPAPSGWRTAADSVDTRLAQRADAAELARLELDSEHAVAFGLSGAAAVAGRANGSTVTYQGVAPHTDLELETRGGGLKETLVLHSAQAPREYVFPLRLKGLTATVVDGEVRLTDAAGQQRAVIPPGFMADAKAQPDVSTAVSYRLVTVDGQPALRLELDPAWLADPARQYPVRVDPSVSPSAATSGMTVHGNGSSSGSAELLVGNRAGAAAAAYLKFDNLVSQLRFHTVYGVQLQVVNFDAASCLPRQVTVHPVTAAWTAGTGHSYPGPAVDSSLAGASFAHGYIRTGETTSACPAAPKLIDLGDQGSKLVQRWVNGEQANNGLSLRASATDTLGWKRFTGTGTANPPKLFVTHSPYNATYSIPKPVPDPPVLQNQAGRVKITVTNRGAEAWAPGAYYLAYRAYNAQTGQPVTQQRAANLTATVARNARVTLDATIAPLPPGTYFLDFTMVKTGGVVFTDHMVPPGRIVLRVFDIPPVVSELHPPNGYQTPTLTPMLWARALDVDAPPGSTLRFKFEVCEQNTAGIPVNCFDSGYLISTAWTVPAGRLSWSRTYLWRAFVQDASNEVPSQRSALLTSVPQPDITSHLAGAPYGSQDKEFDPQVGNFSTAAIDAPVTTVGPELSVVRTYNSLDPRRDSAFGAGWITRYDMRLRPDDDGSGNVVITYPDGQDVRFGRNPDGSFAAPQGRSAKLTLTGTVWTLLDKAHTSYQFSGTGRLIKTTDAAGRSVVLTYNTTDGKLAKAQVSNSQTNIAGRSLRFTWTGNHVTSVTTDLNSTWTYTYTGDLLTRVCAPGAVCTNYAYSPGSHYRSAVLDARPESYWRLGEPQGSEGASEVAVNLGKDAATYKNITLGATGPLAGTGNTAAGFNGTSSTVEIPKGTVKKSRDLAVELWFTVPATGGGGPLLGYQDKALGTASTRGVPVLYIGTDGKLRGQFAGSTITPITSPASLMDGRWHHVVLSTMDSRTTLYLDGRAVGTRTDPGADASLLTFNQLGAGFASTPASWPAWGTSPQRFFFGGIDEVAVYAHPLGPAAVAAHHQLGSAQADQLSRVTLPSGRVAASVSYDTGLDRVREYTDRRGGTWKIGAPAVYGGTNDLRRSVQVLDPANRSYLYEYDALASRLLRSGTPAGLGVRPEDQPGEPTTPPPDPVEECTQPDPGDPRFCTIPPEQTGGPVFVSHPLDGIAIRTFSYDSKGFANVITSENGDTVTMTYDNAGNVTSRRTCRSTTECHTAHITYPAAPIDPFDPRNDLPTESRDGRSASATDNTYRTTYSYTSTGELATQTGPDGSTVRHTYSTGSEAAVGGGIVPAGLVLTTTDPRGAVTRYGYHHNGDLAQLTEPSGMITRYGYDAIGRKVSETETSTAYPNGVTTTYTYDALSRPASTTEPATTDAVTGVRHQQRTSTTYDADGNALRVEVADLLGGDEARVTTMEYDEHGQPSRIMDAEGSESSYGYDRHGNRAWLVDANGNRYEFAYTARNMIAEVRLRDYRPQGTGEPDPGEYLVLRKYSYDFGGRLASETDAMGRRLEYRYYRDDLVQSITLKGLHDPDGGTRDYVVEANTYDGAGNLTRQVTDNGKTVVQHTINANGQVASTVENPGGLARTTMFSYDTAGNITRTTKSGNSSGVPWPVAAVSEIVDFGYDTAGNLTRQASAGSVTSHTYDQRGVLTSSTDPNGRTTTFTSDELGRQVSAAGPAVPVESGGTAPRTVTPSRSVGYNAFDEAVSERDERGVVRLSTYDRIGRVVSTTGSAYTPPSGEPAITPSSRIRYDGMGNVLETTDPLGNAVRFGYDRLNRMVVRDEPASTNAERAVWRYTYTRSGQPLSVTDPGGGRVESTYDDLDRPVTSTQVERRPVAGNFTTRVRYDDAGNVTSVTSPAGAVTANSYDAVGELLTTTDPAGVITRYGYDFAGRQVRAADGLGRTARTDYDLLGRVTGESDLAPNGTTLRGQTYRYDLAGNLLEATNALGKTTTFAYDALDRLVSQIEPASISTGFGYDESGNRTRYTDGRGNATVYTYNTLGLPESVIEPSTPAHPGLADRTWTVSYDAAGQPVRVASPGGVTRTRTFDAAGRLARETGAGAEVATVERTSGYDLLGRLTSVSAPGGSDTFAYDDRGNVLSSDGRAGRATFGYDADGALTTRTDAAGTARFGYLRGRLATMTDGLTGSTQTLGYDAAGELTSIGYGGGLTRTLGYDDLDRPVSDVLRGPAGTVASVAYGYDLDDRLVRKTTAGTAGAGDNTYGYDDAGRLTSWTVGGTTTSYEWDAAGNRTRAGGKAATYDARNRLQSDGDYTYSYSARGTTATRTSSGLTERFSFDAFDRLIAEGAVTYGYDGLDRLATRNGGTLGYSGLSMDPVAVGAFRYSRGPDDELLAVAEGSASRLAISDQHGDLVAALDPANPAAVTSTAYDPFGKVIAGQDQQVGFQGDFTDPDSGAVNMGARWYNPGTGTFLSRDAATYGGGNSVLANRYGYGAADPLGATDPDGNWPCWKCWKWKKWWREANERRKLMKVHSEATNDWLVRSARSQASKSWNWFWRGPVGRGIRSVGGFLDRYVVKPVVAGAKGIWRGAKSGADWVDRKLDDSPVGGYYKRAKAKAEEIRREVERRAKQVTRAAKKAIQYAVTHNPIQAAKAVWKPLYSTIKTVVSAGAHLPAKVVATVHNVVTDAGKAVNVVYHKAVQQVGSVVQEVSDAVDAASELAQSAMPYIKQGLNIVAEVTGFNDIKNCVTKGDVEACAWAALTVAGTLAGGAGGAAVRSARIGMLAAKHGDEAIDAVRGARLAGKSGRAPSRQSCNSFTPDTRVRMADGTAKPIGEVEIGDEVLATDPTTGRTEAQPVTDVITGTGDKELVDVSTDKGTVTATEGHPFWVDSESRWVEAGDLEPGYRFETADHRSATVIQTRAYRQERTVKNLTVDAIHTYSVVAGSADLLVHNGEWCQLHDLGNSDAPCTCRLGRKGQQKDEVIKAEPAKEERVATVRGAAQIPEHLGNAIKHADGAGDVTVLVPLLATVAAKQVPRVARAGANAIKSGAGALRDRIAKWQGWW